MNQPSLYHRIRKTLARCTFAVALISIGNTAIAFDELNQAQTLLFNSPHLMNTKDGQSINYAYHSNMDENKIVDDVVTLNITAEVDEERRDVEIDFLTDERHLILPPFPAYRGNPVLMAMLEHVVREVGEDTGGGALYFRNRIRDELASENVSVKEQEISVNENKIDATVLQFQPFQKDKMISSDSIYADAVFTITLSDTVPGGIVDIGISAGPKAQSAFSRQLTIKN